MGFLSDLEPILAVVTATLDESGTLIEANAGFLRLIKVNGGLPKDMQVAQFFIQPDFATLVGAQADAQGEIHRGLLTMGEYMGRTQTLRACVWRVDARLRVLAEFDIEDLERLNDTVLELNRDYADTQLELAQTNLKLQQHQSQLEQLVAKLTTTNAELKQAQNQLLQSEKLSSIGHLAAGVAHEINNPIGFVTSNFGTLKHYVDDMLSVINAYDSVAASNSPSPDRFAAVNSLKVVVELDYLKGDVLPLLAETQQGLDRVKRIVQALKDFSRIDAVETWKEDDILQGIESTLSVVWNELKHNCDVRKEYGELPPVECVLPHLNQVFMNLLVNAAQAIEGQGVVTIRTGRKGAEVWVEITDTGKGISDEVLAHIFDPFFTTKPVGKGTGLGLSVSYGIVERHHGRIEVDSDVGKGTTFRVCLPIRQPAAM